MPSRNFQKKHRQNGGRASSDICSTPRNWAPRHACGRQLNAWLPAWICPRGVFRRGWRALNSQFGAARRQVRRFPKCPSRSGPPITHRDGHAASPTPRNGGAPPRRRRALRRVVLREGLSRERLSQRVARLAFAARRRETPRALCSSAIRCRGPRRTEHPKLHSARPRATGRPHTPAEPLRRIVPREDLSRGPFPQRMASPELASRRCAAAPRAVCSSAIWWR